MVVMFGSPIMAWTLGSNPSCIISSVSTSADDRIVMRKQVLLVLFSITTVDMVSVKSCSSVSKTVKCKVKM